MRCVNSILFIFGGIDMISFIERLKVCRKTLKVTQKQVAVAIGTSEQNYQRYERGSQQPTLPVLVSLADYFDVSLDYLVGRSDDPIRH